MGAPHKVFHKVSHKEREYVQPFTTGVEEGTYALLLFIQDDAQSSRADACLGLNPKP
jgi:hypothetical protein